MTPNPPLSHARALTRSALASIAGTAVEFAILPVFVRVFHVAEWLSFFLVQFFANAVTFTLYKVWAFEARHHGSVHVQYAKQLVVFCGSLALNTVIPSFLTYRVRLPPELAFAISTALVYLIWNYPGNRYWVFRR